MYKKRFLIIISLVLLGLFSLISLNYIIDPFHVFHKTRFNKGFSEQQRLQNAGLINNFLADEKYNSVILGTSLTECFDTNYIDEKNDGWKTLKLSMSGSSGKEHIKVIDKAVSEADIKNVVIEIRKYVVTDDRYSLQDYLYDNSFINDINYLTSIKILKFFFTKERVYDISKRNNWCPKQQKSFEKYNSEENLKKLALDLKEKRAGFKYIEKSIDHKFYEKYRDMFNKYPKVNFYLIIPPRNLHTVVISQSELNYIKDMTKFFTSFDNVKLFGFDNIKKITNDLSNYKDVEHYKAWVNDYMIDAIADDKHRLSNSNIDGYINEIVEQVKSYRVCSAGKCYK